MAAPMILFGRSPQELVIGAKTPPFGNWCCQGYEAFRTFLDSEFI
jgi:hypothetical protein